VQAISGNQHYNNKVHGRWWLSLQTTSHKKKLKYCNLCQELLFSRMQYYAGIAGFLSTKYFARWNLCCKLGAVSKENVEFSEAQLQLLDVQAIMQDV